MYILTLIGSNNKTTTKKNKKTIEWYKEMNKSSIPIESV